jgi:hypothetical protein
VAADPDQGYGAAAYDPYHADYASSEAAVSRRPSNMSLGGLPAGAAGARSRTHLLDPAEQHEYYTSAETSPLPPSSPESSTNSRRSLLDRNGTLRSNPSISSGHKLAIANPDA